MKYNNIRHHYTHCPIGWWIVQHYCTWHTHLPYPHPVYCQLFKLFMNCHRLTQYPTLWIIQIIWFYPVPYSTISSIVSISIQSISPSSELAIFVIAWNDWFYLICVPTSNVWVWVEHKIYSHSLWLINLCKWVGHWD